MPPTATMPTSLDNTKTTADAGAAPKILLTVEQAAERLNIGRTLFYSLISTGEINTVRIGRLRRVHPDDLDAYAGRLRRAAQPINA